MIGRYLETFNLNTYLEAVNIKTHKQLRWMKSVTDDRKFDWGLEARLLVDILRLRLLDLYRHSEYQVTQTAAINYEIGHRLP